MFRFYFVINCFKCICLYILLHLTNVHGEECKPVAPGTAVLHDEVQSSGSVDAGVEIRTVGTWLHGRYVRGHYILVSHPAELVSVLEPGGLGGCAAHSRGTAVGLPCLAAVNAGYFNTHTGACLGNIISNGKKVQDNGGIQNAHFGIKRNGNLFFGYLASGAADDREFLQLVGGVGWIRSNGSTFLNASKSLECAATQETGSLDRFYSVRSARTAVGTDKDGQLVVLQMDGKTDVDGVNLWEMDSLLSELGVQSAINLDGGGSATFAANSTLANYPSDPCSGDENSEMFRCPRKVSTVLCVHHPPRPPVIITKDNQVTKKAQDASSLYKWGFVAICILCALSLLANFLWIPRQCHYAVKNQSIRLSRMGQSDLYQPMIQEP